MYIADVFSIFAAGAAAALVGWAWYHPRVFGSAWMRMTNVTPEMAEAGKRTMPLRILIGFAANILVAFVLYYFGNAVGIWNWIGAIVFALWCWAGFVVPVLLGSVLWDHKPLKLYLINVFYWLAACITIALVLFH